MVVAFKVRFRNLANALPKPTEVVADTAQVTVGGLQHIKHFGLTLEELNEPLHGLQYAGGNPLKVLGSYPVSVMHNGQSADTEVYFAQGVKHMYLSLDVCKKIDVVHKEFPQVDLSSTSSINNITVSERVERLPSRPAYIPYLATEENISKLEAWLWEKFSSTAFNITDPLPLMSGKPHKFHLEENAVPFAAHTPGDLSLFLIIGKMKCKDNQRKILRRVIFEDHQL